MCVCVHGGGGYSALNNLVDKLGRVGYQPEVGKKFGG